MDWRYYKSWYNLPLEFQERMIMVKEWWSSVLKGGLCVGNTYFEQRSLHKYTRVARGQDGMKVRNMIDLVLVRKNMQCYVQDVRAVRAMGQGF